MSMDQPRSRQHRPPQNSRRLGVPAQAAFTGAERAQPPHQVCLLIQSNSSGWKQWIYMITSNHTDAVGSDDANHYKHKLPTSSIFESAPRQFFDSDKFHKLVSMGDHFLMIQSGCQMVWWIYPIDYKFPGLDDCEIEYIVSSRRRKCSTVLITLTRLFVQ
jgi:hypothetical protein